MDFAFQPHLYRAVPVLLWPCLFWRLWRIALWIRATGRDVMIGVDRYGRVYITHLGDDPSRWAPSRHPHLHNYYLSARMPDESRDGQRRRLAATYAPGFGVQAWLISPCALGDEVAEICFPERPAIRDPVALGFATP